MDRHRYTPEEIEFVRRHLPGRSYAEFTAMFNQHFGLQQTCERIEVVARYRGIRNGLDGRFQHGHAPLSGTEASRFKKGQIAKNRKPIGAERTSSLGYSEIKVASPQGWRAKHSVIWESLYGQIPKGHVVVFGDGNKRNFAPGNLVLVSLKEMAIMNRHRMIGGSAELTQTGKLVADVYLAITDRRKEENNGTDQNQPARNREPETDSRRKTGAGG